MSYILDALQKSDQERKQGEPPSIHTIHRNTFNPKSFRRKPGRRPKILIAVALLFAGVIIFSSYFLKSGISHVHNPHEPDPNVVAIEENKAAQVAESNIESSTEPITPFPTQPEEEVTTVIQQPPKIPKIKKKVILQPLPLDEQLAHYESPSPDLKNSSPQEVPKFKDLPLGLQSLIPPLKFAGHTYSDDPAQRMIIVNNRILKEGNAIDHETRLIEITWEGVVLQYDGENFFMQTD